MELRAVHCSWERLATPRSSGRPDSHPDFRKQETERSAGAYPTADETMIRDHSRLWTDYFWATASNSAQFGSNKSHCFRERQAHSIRLATTLLCAGGVNGRYPPPWLDGADCVATRCSGRLLGLMFEVPDGRLLLLGGVNGRNPSPLLDGADCVVPRCGCIPLGLMFEVPRRTTTAARRRERPESSTISSF